ncbi:MAG: hypothetical protein HRT80_12735 [Henriciella sp.]|nr:hypothetical protein [Henriciella sp.]
MTPSTLKPVHVAFGLMALLAGMVAFWPLGIGIDYYNHLARTYIQGHLASEPALQGFYAVSFDFIPDLTMDMIIPWLSQWIGIYAAGGVTVWLALIFPPVAGLVLSKSLHGRVTWVSLLGFLTVFNANMGWGFVNYTVSSGLAVLAFALWVRMAPSWRRTVLFAPISLFLVANHALAFLLFGFLAFSWEVIGYLKQERGSLWTFVRQLAVLDFPAMLAGLVFIALSMQGAADLPQDVAPLYDLREKTGILFAATDFNNRLLALVAVLAVAGFFWTAVRQNWVSFAPNSAWLCAAFLALVIVIPSSIFGIWGLHLRFTAPLLIVAVASIAATEAFPARLKPALAGGFAVLGALSFANAGLKMSAIDSQANALKAQLVDLPKGSKVLGVYVDLSSGTAFNTHALSLAVIERDAYVPNLFTNTSFVDVAPALVDLHMPQANPVFAQDLAALAERPRVASENGYWSPAFANDWPEQWDYLLMFKTPEQDDLSELPVCAVSATPEIILYKTEPCT